MNNLIDLLNKYGATGSGTDGSISQPTNIYTQTAAQDNPDYAAMLSVINKHNDLDRNIQNSKINLLNSGLENLYKEKLQKDRDNFEIYKLRESNKLAKDREKAARDYEMAKLKWQRENTLADRKEAREFVEQERQKAYQLGLQQKPIYGKITYKGLKNPFTNKTNDVVYNQRLSENVSPELEELYQSILTSDDYQKNFQNRDLFNMLANSATQKYNKIENAPLLNRLLEEIDQQRQINSNKKSSFKPTKSEYLNQKQRNDFYDQYRNNFLETVGTPDLDWLDRIENAAGLNNREQNVNYLMQDYGNRFQEINQNSTDDPKYKQIYSQFNLIPRQDWLRMGFTDTNGMNNKVLFEDQNTGDLLLLERGGNLLYRFGYNPETGNYEEMGPVNYDSLDENINNYQDRRYFEDKLHNLKKGSAELIGTGIKNIMNTNLIDVLKDLPNIKLYQDRQGNVQTLGGLWDNIKENL